MSDQHRVVRVTRADVLTARAALTASVLLGKRPSDWVRKVAMVRLYSGDDYVPEDLAETPRRHGKKAKPI